MDLQPSAVADVSPAHTWRALSADPRAVLLDVRTAAEWTFVGLPDLSEINGEVLTVEWQTFPGMARNPDFLAQVTARVTPDRPVYLLCRSGVRSRHAGELLAAHGYTPYNIADGFEGPLDAAGRRTVAGWKVDGLPWRQG